MATEERPARQRVAAGLALGAALALAPRGLRGLAGPPRPGPVAVWAADRDGCAVVGLDRDLFASRRVALPWPVRVAARPGGGAWVAAALEGRPRGPHALFSVGADGEAERLAELGPVRDLFGSSGGELFVLEERGERCRLLRFGGASRAEPQRFAEPGPGATCLAVREAREEGERVLVGHADGVLELLGPGGALAARERAPGAVLDVAPAPEGGWWVLRAAEAERGPHEDRGGGRGADEEGTGTRLERRDATLAARWTASVPAPARCLAPVVGAERVWLQGEDAPLPLRVGGAPRGGGATGGDERGAIELRPEPLPLFGALRAAATRDGGLLVAAPGAVLRLDPSGEPLPGQGGFSFLADLDPVPGPGAAPRPGGSSRRE